MSPAVAAAPLPTKSEIENWDTSYLDTAATSWRSAATASEDAFDQHRRNIDAPGGTMWTGDAKDAALDRVTKDVAVVGRQSSMLREAAGLAENGGHDIDAAKRDALAAITAAVDDGFNVAEDLSVTDAREYDIDTVADRNRAAAEHAEDISWAAQHLVQADQLVGNRLKAKAADLEGVRFEGEGEGRDSSSGRVYLADHELKHDAEGNDRSGEKKPEIPAQTPGQIGPFAVPKSVEDAAKKPGEKPPSTTGDVGGDLGDLLGTNDPATAGAEPKPAAVAMSPQQVEQFKSQARNILRQQGVPPEQIESRVNAMVTEAQRVNTALTDSAAHTPAKPDTTPGPAPADTRSFGEKLGDGFNNFVHEAHDQFYNRLDSTVETLQNLTGTGGEGRPGVLESWQQLAEGAVQNYAQDLKEDPLRLRDPLGPLGPWGAVNDVVHEIPEIIDNPGKKAGDVLFDATATAVTAPLGGEALLGRSLLPDLGALERGLVSEGGRTLENGAASAVPRTPDLPPVHHTPEPPPVPHTAEPVVPHTADPPPVHHSAEPVVPHTADPPPINHSAEPVVPHTADPPPINHSAEPPVGHHADAPPPAHSPDSPPTGHLPPHGEPGSFGYDENGDRLRYANSRPDYGPTQEADTWDISYQEQIADIGNGILDLPPPKNGEIWVQVLDDVEGPNIRITETGERYELITWEPGTSHKGLWDMGHVSGQEYRYLREDYLSGRITFEEFMEAYRDPDNYRVQDPARNRSHIDEGS